MTHKKHINRANEKSHKLVGIRIIIPPILFLFLLSSLILFLVFSALITILVFPLTLLPLSMVVRIVVVGVVPASTRVLMITPPGWSRLPSTIVFRSERFCSSIVRRWSFSVGPSPRFPTVVTLEFFRTRVFLVVVGVVISPIPPRVSRPFTSIPPTPPSLLLMTTPAPFLSRRPLVVTNIPRGISSSRHPPRIFGEWVLRIMTLFPLPLRIISILARCPCIRVIIIFCSPTLFVFRR